MTDRGSGCLPGVVDSGLKSTIIAPPTRRTPLAGAGVSAAPGAAAPAIRSFPATGRNGRVTCVTTPRARARQTSEIRDLDEGRCRGRARLEYGPAGRRPSHDRLLRA